MNIEQLELVSLDAKHINEIVEAFTKIGWNKPASLYEKYLNEQVQKLRTVLIATQQGIFCGYVTIKWQSEYPAFNSGNIPEIVDLNVLPDFRGLGIGTKLIQACEQIAKDHGHTEIGLGVGMTSDYGSAQRLYVYLGYVPDGHGLFYKKQALSYGDTVMVDDDLVLYFRKKLSI